MVRHHVCDVHFVNAVVRSRLGIQKQSVNIDAHSGNNSDPNLYSYATALHTDARARDTHPTATIFYDTPDHFYDNPDLLYVTHELPPSRNV